MKDEWQPLLAACILLLCSAVAFGLFISPASPWLPYELAVHNEGHIIRLGNERDNQNAAGHASAAPRDQSFGLLHANPDDCYQGESQGDCAARIVQDHVAWAYVWLVVAAVMQLVVGVLTFCAIDRQRRIMDKQTTIIRQQADIAERAMTIDKQPAAFVKRVAFKAYKDRGASVLDNPTVDCTVGFVGDTPATLVLFSLAFEFGPKPGEGGNALGGISSTSTHVMSGGEDATQSAMLTQIDEAIKNQIRGYDGGGGYLPLESLWWFFVHGHVVFNDVFGYQHELVFCYRAPAGGGVGRIHGGSERNYRRQRKPGEWILLDRPPSQ